MQGLRQLPVHLEDAVEAMSDVIAGGRVVFRARRSSQRGGRPQTRERAGAIEKILGDLVVTYAIVIEYLVSDGLVGRGGLGRFASSSDQKALMFAGKIEEKLVLQDGAADRETVVLIAGFRLDGLKGIRRLEEFVVVEVKRRAVQRIRTRLDSQVDGATGVAPEFSRACGHKGKVLNGIDGKYYTRDAVDSCLVDGGNIPPQVVVVGALNLPID
jgi:hypothetical protein